MKAKVKRGSGFRGALDYLFGKPGHELIASNMAGADPRQLAQEFGVSRQLRTECERPVWHCSLALPENENLSADKWDQVINDHLINMGLDPAKHQFVAVKHTDTNNEHVHVVASRIGLDASIWHGKWEARTAIESTQELEIKHGLTLTPGLGNPRLEKQLTDKEINMAVRTGQEPPRQKLQRLVNEAKADQPTAPEFMERLLVAGVGVKANVAKTGKMNGFSFEIDGIPFKASQLGKGYAWGQLKNEVKYVETEHSEELRRLNAAVVSDQGTPELEQSTPGIEKSEQPAPGIEKSEQLAGRSGPEDSEYGKELEPAAGSDSPGSIRGNGIERENEQVSATAQRNSQSAEVEHRPDLGSHQSGDEPGDQQQDQQNGPELGQGQAIGVKAEQVAEQHSDSDRDGDRELERGNSQLVSGSKSVEPGVRENSRGELENLDNIKPDNEPDNSRLSNRGEHMAWNSRFKLASKRKKLGESLGTSGRQGQGSLVEPNQIADAKTIDPRRYFESMGYEIRKDGQNHLSIRSDGIEYFRSSFKDGKWLHCYNDGTGIGDNIALVRELENCSFSEAVYKLNGDPQLDISRPTPVYNQPRPATRPRLPRQTEEARAEGRAYLQGRGISQDTLDHAENSGFLHHVSGGPCFVGYDQKKKPRNVTKRLIEPEFDKDGEPITKRDFKHTDKAYAAILPGRADSVWIVEGGADALALHDLHKRRNIEPPTVIVSGGANVLKFTDNPAIQQILQGAEKVVIAHENEKDAEVQAKADKGHEKQAQAVAQVAMGVKVGTYKPPQPEHKDLAEQNQAEAAAEKKKLFDRERHRQEREEKARNRGPQLEMG